MLLLLRAAEVLILYFFFSSRRRHTRYWRDWSSDVCSSDLCGPCRSGVRPPRRRLRVSRSTDERRSEERRVGKECRCRGLRDHEKKKGQKPATVLMCQYEDSGCW